MRKTTVVLAIVIVLILAAVGIAYFSLTPQRPLTKVNLELDIPPLARHTPFFVALEKGYWNERNIEVTIIPGTAVLGETVISGKSQFYFGLITDVINVNAKGADLITVARIYDYLPLTLFAQPHIKGPKNLEGAKYAIPPGAVSDLLLPYFCQKTGIDCKKINIVNTAQPNLIPSLLAKQVDATATFVFFTGFVRSQMPDATILTWRELGVELLGNGIIVRKELTQKDPALVRDFVAGAIKGYEFTMQNPDEAVDIFVKHNPAIPKDRAKTEIPVLKDLVLGQDAKAKGIGWADPQRVQTTLDVMKQYYKIDKPMTMKDIFTEEFLPKR